MGEQISDRHNPSQQLKVNADGSIDVTLLNGDIQIGAVELKDGTSDTRAKIDTDGNLHVAIYNSLVPEIFDYIVLTYVAAGNGAGEVETVVYKTGGAGGTTQATLTLAYDANNKLSTVTRS